MNPLDVVVEARGSHFVAWAREASGKPREAVLMVGQSAEEAEARLRAWFEARQPA